MYGDTNAMRAHADRLRDQGAELRALADRLVAHTAAAGWTGGAAEALERRIRLRAARLQELAARHDEAADALGDHRRRVDHLTEAIAAAERRAARLPAEAGFTPPAPGHRDWLDVDLPEG